MQATPTTNKTIKLTTTTPTTTKLTPLTQTTATTNFNTTISSGVASNNNTNNSNKSTTKTLKTSISKKTTLTTTTTTTHRSNETNASKEIEEISKKISEHADAIYRTWKYRGLAPTELLDIYTNATGTTTTPPSTTIEQQQQHNSVSPSRAELFGETAEGLQQLVNQFVIKDKEQRGVKHANVNAYGSGICGGNLHKSQRTEIPITTEISPQIPKTAAATTTTTSVSTIKNMPENIGNKMTQKSIGGTLKQTTTPTSSSTVRATGLQKPTTTTTTSSSILLKSAQSNESASAKKFAKSTGIVTSSSPTSPIQTSTSSATTVSPLQTATATSSTTSIKNNACVKNVNSAQQLRNSSGGNNVVSTKTPAGTATTPTKRTSLTKLTGGTTNSNANAAPTLDINLNLDLGFDDLQLDVNGLSQLQTQNLMKIKELLEENATTQEKKKSTVATSKIATKTKQRANSPAKILDTTDSPVNHTTTIKTKSTKTLNDTQYNSNNDVSVKKITKNSNKNNGLGGETTTIMKTPTATAMTPTRTDDDGVISKLINANDNTLSGEQISSVKTTITKTPTSKANTTTKSPTTTIKSTNIKSPTITNSNAAAVTAEAQLIAVASTATTAPPKTSTNVGPIELADEHQSIKTIGGSITNGSATIQAEKSHTIGLTTTQKAATIKTTTKDSKSTNQSEVKIGHNNNNNQNNNNSSSSSVKAQRSEKSISAITTINNNNNSNNKSNTPKATNVAAVGAATATATATATTTTTATATATIGDMEIARQSNGASTSANNTSNTNGSNSSNGSNTMPAPTKVKSGRTATTNVARPFLTRGSVAERVLMFEKCPDVRNSFLNIKRPDLDSVPKSLLKVKLHATPPVPPEQHNTLQKQIRSTRSVYIPRFYFPHGKPQPQIAQERILRGVYGEFDCLPNNQATKDELPRILKLCGLPYYWRMPVMVFCHQAGQVIERSRYVEFWKQMNVYCHDASSRFVYILSRGQRFRSYITPEDLVPLVQDVVDTHPGLAFLKEATEFHSRYVHTVIARIFYSVNRSWTGKITMSELKKSDLLEIITLLEEEDDINQIMAFFSYEHFYVIYCKFWELDKDHDLLINQDDLARYSDHALSTRIVERIFSGCVTRSDQKKNSKNGEPKMSYTEFVWFLLSEVDKRTPTAIEYWFRCMDLDGDGQLSMYELEYFYEEQQQRMESIGIETLPFEDCLCQMLDMIKPQRRDAITLGDLKRCKMTHVFFDTFFNLERYLDHEQRDPFASQRDEYTSDWDRFAAQEYELLITEEND